MYLSISISVSVCLSWLAVCPYKQYHLSHSISSSLTYWVDIDLSVSVDTANTLHRLQCSVHSHCASHSSHHTHETINHIYWAINISWHQQRRVAVVYSRCLQPLHWNGNYLLLEACSCIGNVYMYWKCLHVLEMSTCSENIFKYWTITLLCNLRCHLSNIIFHDKHLKLSCGDFLY